MDIVRYRNMRFLSSVSIAGCPLFHGFFSVLRNHEIVYGSGSADPYLGLMDSDPDLDPAIFDSEIQEFNKKNFYLLLYTYIG